MANKELEGWFEDKAQNRFNIDGLAKGAGNKNHFIMTPLQLADKYSAVLKNPDPKEALRGDLTTMLTYVVPLYSHQGGARRELLQEFIGTISGLKPNQIRIEANMAMLKNDAKKFKFMPDDTLFEKGFNADVKKEIYRFPSILLLDVCIVSEHTTETSWSSLEKLFETGTISQDLADALKFLLAAATYIRLSAYLFHDSHDDRMSLAAKISKMSMKELEKGVQSTRRWFLPHGLFCHICTVMIPLKKYLAEPDFKADGLKIYRTNSRFMVV